MDRLKLLDAGLRAFDARLPDVTPPLCVATRYRASSCRRCLDVCPADAVEPSPWLRVEPDRCTSCGACAAVCPTGALVFSMRSELLRGRFAELARRAPRQATLVCRFAGDEEGGGGNGGDRAATVVLSCLGGLSAADLVGAAALGLDGVTLTSGDCEGCRDRQAGMAAQRAVGAADAALAALGRGLAVERRRAPGDGSAAAPAAPGLSRRDLFSFLSRGARRATAEGLAPERRTVGDLHVQAPPPVAHARLLDDLDHLGGGGAADAAPLPAALPLATVLATGDCTGCGLCARYCPHGALVLADGVLSCDSSRCTGCGLCSEACPPAALEVRPATAPAAARAAGRGSSVVRLWPAL